MRNSQAMTAIMINLMFMALATTASGIPLEAPIEQAKPEVAAAQVAACGFSKVQVTFNDSLHEDIVEILDVRSVSNAQLHCAALESLATRYYVVFPASVERAYQSLYWSLSKERDRADAKAWLQKRGLLSRLPTYVPNRSNDSAFARTLERLCGPKAVGTLKATKGRATFVAEALLEGRMDDETLECLVNAAAASGYTLGFIGNEAYRKEP